MADWETVGKISPVAKDGDGWETVGKTPQSDKGALHAAGRSAVEGVAPAGGFLAGMGAGMAAIAPVAEGAGALSGPAAPLVAGALELVGGLAGGFVGSEAIHKVQDQLHQLIAPEDYKARQLEKQQHPTATMVGDIASSAIGFSPKTAAEVAGKVWTKPIVQRGASATLMAGTDAAQQAVGDQPMDWKRVGLSAVQGAAMPSLNVAGKVVAGVGEKIVSTAFKSKTTGKVEEGGPSHDPKKKKDTDLEPGFVTNKGEFLTRMEAVRKGIETKQITPDQHLENPEEGLHSGDLRNADVEEFDKPANLEDHRSAIETQKNEVERLMQKARDHQDAGDEASANKYAQDAKEAFKAQQHLESTLPKVEADAAAEKVVKSESPKSPLGEMYREGLKHDEGIAQAKTTIGLIDHIISKLGPDHYVSEVLHLFKSNLAEDLPVHILNREEMSQLAQSHGRPKESAGMWVQGEGIYLERGVGTNSQVAAHEVGHATLATKLESIKNLPKDHPKQIEYQKLLSDVKALLSEVESKIDWKKLGKEQTDALRYALQDEHEFISDGLFNPVVMRELFRIEGKKRGPVASIVKKISNFFGLDNKQYTAFHELLETTNKLAKAKLELQEGRESKASTPVAKEPAESKLPEDLKKESSKVDPRSVPNKELMEEHALKILDEHGEEAAYKFYQDWNLDQKERAIPIPDSRATLDDALHKINTFMSKDKSEHVTSYKENTAKGITPELREKWFRAREGEITLSPEEQAQLDSVLKDIDTDNKAQIDKIKALGGEVGREYSSSQSRIRLFGGDTKTKWTEMVKNFFKNESPLTEKVAEEANAAIERKVFQLEDGRVIELARGKDSTVVHEWKDGKKRQIGESRNLELSVGDSINGKKIVDGKVHDIEAQSPYRYLKDAEASARMANMGLRKMARDLEFLESLKKSDLFKDVGRGPDTPLKDVPPGFRVPENIDKIPQLRGWMFDTKTAAIIEDFAKVWDNNLLSKLSSAVIKNMMLNPLPHMFNEAMHLWNARGFTGWVTPGGVGRFHATARQAWNDVAKQTQFYRDVMREGGSVLGADPRNKYFTDMLRDQGKALFADPKIEKGLGALAKKMGTTVGELYNGLSTKSTQAMWFTRDVMYVQYIREIQRIGQERTGKSMELKEAIHEAERHMPNYRMPSEILGSRGVAKTLKNPNISVFSRYHYGMVKSMIETMKDLNPANLKTKEGQASFRDGVDSMLAVGVAMSVLYPLMDMMAEEIFGKGAEQRRAGPYHLLKAIGDVASGDKDMSALIWPMFTFNPMLLMLGQLAFNKQIFSGKPIYHPSDSVEQMATDVTKYVAGQVPQGSSLVRSADEEGGDQVTQFVAKQADIKVTPPKTQARADRAKMYGERERKKRARIYQEAR